MKNLTLSQKLHKNRNDIVPFCRKFKKIYLYGAGEVASRFVHYLEEENICIDGVVVSDIADKKMQHFLSYPVYIVSELSFDNDQDGIIVAVGENTQNDIRKILKKYGYTKNIYFQNMFFVKNKKTCLNYLLPVAKTSHEGYFADYKKLEVIGQKFETDKNKYKHNYLNKYDFFLQHFKKKSFNFVELGVFQGASLKMWGEYFSAANIIGVDVNPECLKYAGENRKIVITDLSKECNIEEIGKLNPSVIIDDASHLWSHQIKALCMLFPCLPHGGIYIIEDLETSFQEYSECGYGDAVDTGYNICKHIAEVVTSQEKLSQKHVLKDEIEKIASEVELVSFLHGSCIFVKK